MNPLFHLLKAAHTAPIIALPHPDFSAAGLEAAALCLYQNHPTISGNKLLKLQYWLQAYEEGNYKGICTRGGPWSNHVYACAYACAELQISFTAILKASAHTPTAMIHDIAAMGADIIYAHHQAFSQEQTSIETAAGKNLLYIPLGGDGPEGVKGVQAYFTKLQLQDYTHIVCAVGSGTTLSGIAEAMPASCRLIGINPGIYDERFTALENSWRSKGKQVSIVKVAGQKRFGRYAPELPALMNHWYARWQLPTDIIYTAKVMAAMLLLAKQGFFERDSKLLMVHTGGLQGNRSLPTGLLDF